MKLENRNCDKFKSLGEFHRPWYDVGSVFEVLRKVPDLDRLIRHIFSKHDVDYVACENMAQITGDIDLYSAGRALLDLLNPLLRLLSKLVFKNFDHVQEPLLVNV